MPEEIRSTSGRILGGKYTVTFTPEVLLWLNSDSGKKYHRKIFFKKLENLLQDINQFGVPKRGRAKLIASVERPVYTIRLENDQGIRILFDYATHEGFVNLWILAVSEKKEFQDKLERSAEHIVHASSFDRLTWENDDDEYIDLAKCTQEDLEELRKSAQLRFGNLPTKEQAEGWSSNDFETRKRRATIYDFVIPNVIDYSILKETNDFDLPPILKLQDHQKELMNYEKNQFLLEGVAGTGKTTILLYRFVSDVKHLTKTIDNCLEKILFITHNERLKKDIVNSLKLFFPPDEYIKVSKRVKTTRELFFELIGITRGSNKNPTETEKRFSLDFELTRERFRRMLDKNDLDIDLFWEEYRGILRGYNLRGDSAIISKKEYNDIGRRRGRIKPSQRDDFYYFANAKKTNARGLNSSIDFTKHWDSLSLCREVYQNISTDEQLQNIECMYVDEVQDLTKAEMEVLLLLLNPDGLSRFAVAGDLSQSIQPSSFTWQALSDLIYTILDIKVEKHDTLLENFRSTPYLVQAANRILELQDELDHDATPELQRPFAGENTGEPGHIFLGNENEIIEELLRRELPNAACPILVRDRTTMQRLRKRLGNSNVITIAQFKGLERRNILLWEPDSGSEGILNLRHDPVRGSFAKKREYSGSTALLELRHVFVAFTRARYMMGVLAPKNQKSHFMKHLLSLEESGLQDSELEKLQLFEQELSTEALLEYAREYEEAGMFVQAAEAYRNLNDEHKYEHCKGKAAIDDQIYVDAIHHLYRAAKVEIGIQSEDAGKLISEISTSALDATNRENRPETLAKILMGSIDLSETAFHRLKAEQDEERENWASAAKHYIKASDVSRAEFCIRRISKNSVQTSLYIECGNMANAKESFKRYAEEYLQPTTAVSIALGEKKTIQKFFSGPLKPLRNDFADVDIGWARMLAAGDKNLLSHVNDHARLQILERVNTSEKQEREVLQELIKLNDSEELNKRNVAKKWKFIESEAIVEYHIMEKNLSQAVRSIFDIPNLGRQEQMLKMLGKQIERRDVMLGLYKVLSNNPVKIPANLSSRNEFFDMIIAIGIISESTKVDSSEFQTLRKQMYANIGLNKNLTNFCIAWSTVLMNFQIRNGTNEIEPIEKFELEVLININETDNYKTLDLIALYALHEELRSEANDQNLRILWNKLNRKQIEAIQINIALGSPSSLNSLPKYMEMQGDTEIFLAKFRREYPGAKGYEKEMKKEFKLIKKEFKQYHITPLNYRPSQLRNVFKSKLRTILALSPIVYLCTGNHQFASDFQSTEPAPISKRIPQIKPIPTPEVNEVDQSEKIEQVEPVNQTPKDLAKLTDEIAEDMLLDDFETEGIENTTSAFEEDAWRRLIDSDPENHLKTAKEIINLEQFESNLDKRTHLLACLDECLVTTQTDVQAQHRFAVILGIQDLARVIEQNSNLVNILPESSEQGIRLFKGQNKTAILKTRLPYSMRVLN